MNIVIKYGDNVDTDVIIPARYLNTTDKKALAAHCMEDIDKDFHAKITTGDILAAGKNFGCGSSREHAPMVLKESGIGLIVAESFARIFYRNAINIGLPIVECAEAAREAENGDELAFDAASGVLTNKTKGYSYNVPPFPEFLQKIVARGGLMEVIEAGEL